MRSKGHLGWLSLPHLPMLPPLVTASPTGVSLSDSALVSVRRTVDGGGRLNQLFVSLVSVSYLPSPTTLFVELFGLHSADSGGSKRQPEGTARYPLKSINWPAPLDPNSSEIYVTSVYAQIHAQSLMVQWPRFCFAYSSRAFGLNWKRSVTYFSPSRNNEWLCQTIHTGK